MPLTSAQLQARRSGVFASEAAAVLGLSRFATPLDIYFDKTSDDPPVDAFDARSMPAMGTAIEEGIITWYEGATGLRGQHFPETMFSSRYPWLGCHLDWLGADRVCDAKLSGGHGDYGDAADAVPQEVMIQVTVQMLVAEREFAQVAAFLLRSAGRGRSIIVPTIYDIPFNKELGDAIIEGTHAFWQRVQRRDPPPPSSVAEEVLLYPRSSPRVVTADEALEAKVKALREVKGALALLKADAENLENEIKVALKDAEALVAPGGRPLVTWKSDAKGATRIDLDQLRAEYPEAAAACSRTGVPTRRFLVKK